MTIKQLRDENALLRDIATNLHWMSRRYADGRQSVATLIHNDCTVKLLKMGVNLNATGDKIVWARDAMGRAFDKLTDAQCTPGTDEAMWINYNDQ